MLILGRVDQYSECWTDSFKNNDFGFNEQYIAPPSRPPALPRALFSPALSPSLLSSPSLSSFISPFLSTPSLPPSLQLFSPALLSSLFSLLSPLYPHRQIPLFFPRLSPFLCLCPVPLHVPLSPIFATSGRPAAGVVTVLVAFDSAKAT